MKQRWNFSRDLRIIRLWSVKRFSVLSYLLLYNTLEMGCLIIELRYHVDLIFSIILNKWNMDTIAFASNRFQPQMQSLNPSVDGGWGPAIRECSAASSDSRFLSEIWDSCWQKGAGGCLLDEQTGETGCVVKRWWIRSDSAAGSFVGTPSVA